ncbi:hypothetical protein [Lysobacter gummosus]|uniref:hypothetical protein n=1 Tax=Lysobacter gummosus TaxID=262324 RepID=UPI0036440163
MSLHGFFDKAVEIILAHAAKDPGLIGNRHVRKDVRSNREGMVVSLGDGRIEEYLLNVRRTLREKIADQGRAEYVPVARIQIQVLVQGGHVGLV